MKAPLTLRLPFGLVDEGFYFLRHLVATLGVSSRDARELRPAFDVSEPEKQFVRHLLRHKRNLWLYRCHQQRFCGDFILVDMSANEPNERRALVLELKEREAVKLSVEPAGQLRNAPTAIAELHDAGVLADGCTVELARGGSHEIIDWLDSWF